MVAERRQAAARFKVASSAIRWAELKRRRGGSIPGLVAARAVPLEPHAAWLLALVERETDLTLAELAPQLKTTEAIGASWTRSA